MPLTFGLFVTTAFSKPAVQSVAFLPNPLVAGQNFTISVTASPDVTEASATLDFQPGNFPSQAISLTNQGSSWVGVGTVPPELKSSDKTEAKIKVTLFDADQHRTEQMIRVDVTPAVVFAVFANGILTVTGDDQDNTLTVSRDVAGSLLVNGGAVPVQGGTATVGNTSLIRMFGLKGDDTLSISEVNGPMPPAELDGGEGDDLLTGSAAADRLDGGPGNDTLRGKGGEDHLLGGTGNDILDGGAGTDEMIGGAGDDQIIWNPGDGSDLVEGQEGEDTLVFVGGNGSEAFDVSANGQRLRFFRNPGNITMDCDGIERVVLRAASGADSVTVNDLSATLVTKVLLDLGGSNGTGDSAADSVIINGTGTNDVIAVSGSVTNVDITGLSATVTIVNSEPQFDTLTINALGGDDTVDASKLAADALTLTLNGGAGNDTLIGSQGNDTINGNQGTDVMFGQGGDDTFIWNPGDGNDIIEGQGGVDTMLFNGANLAETVDISANGQRLRFTRNLANIVMDCDGVEIVKFNALGGADQITVNSLVGTAVTKVNLDLGNPPTSSGDGTNDTVIINGTAGDDTVAVNGTAAGIDVLGLAAAVNIVGSEGTVDQLIIKLLAGDDVMEASDLLAGLIKLTVDGGVGNDILVGSHGDDTLIGGEGDDTLIGGDGLDVLDGGPGNNTIIQ